MGVKVGVGCTRDGIHAARKRNLFRDVLRPHSHKHTVTGRRHCRPRGFPGRPHTFADGICSSLGELSPEDSVQHVPLNRLGLRQKAACEKKPDQLC